MAEEQHVQCKFSKGRRVNYGWLPKKPYLQVGALVAIQFKDNGEYEPGWRIEEMWAARPSKMIKENARNFYKHRSGTDAKRGHDGSWTMPDK